MKKTLLISILVVGLGFSMPAFASGYIVNGHAASPMEEHYLAAHGFQPGAWVADGWGIGPAVAVPVVQPVEAVKQCQPSANVSLCH